MTPKDWKDYNLQFYEKNWFEKLEKGYTNLVSQEVKDIFLF